MNSFQSDFAQALFAPDLEAVPSFELARQPAFAVYRNTVMKGCIDALEANFPAVARLVGREWFRSAAADYVRTRPPQDARMLAYGDDGFGAFVQSLPSAAALSYLDGVAWLDTLWRAAHAAPDAPVLDAAQLAGEGPEALAARVLRLHPATRWAWFAGAPVATIWSRNRSDDAVDGELAWHGEGLALTRVNGAVQSQPLSRGGCAFLDGCTMGLTLGEAADRALRTDSATDVAALLAALLSAGAFTPGEDS